jgi:predicted porin
MAVKFDPTAGSAVSPLQNVTAKNTFLMGTVTEGARGERAVAYISPKFADSVTVAVNYSTAMVSGVGGNALGNLTQTTDTKHSAFLASVNYEQGPLAIGGAYATLTAAGSDAAKEYMFGASFDLGMAKLLGTYQSRKLVASSVTDKAYSISAVAPVGAGAVVATIAGTKMQAASTNGSGMTVAYLQNLSKTVTAYAAYSRVSQDSGTSGYSVVNSALTANLTAGGSSNLVAVGLRKKF